MNPDHVGRNSLAEGYPIPDGKTDPCQLFTTSVGFASCRFAPSVACVSCHTIRVIRVPLQVEAAPKIENSKFKINLPIQHRERQAADGDEAVALVVDVDLPDLRPATNMNRGGGAHDHALAHSAEVVRVDLNADAVLLLYIDAQRGRRATERFGEHDRGPAVEQAQRLGRPVIDGHRGLQIIVSDLGEGDIEMVDHVDAAPGVDLFEGQRALPDRFSRRRVFHTVV